ncbi:MAG TPA: isoprenylcysteine carboxylmethyltransferase family protein [Gaiellaceae bacterium]|nr:isoprenylcysteine carboxylmethyltransferase family protein [Gaiellaceae bacterium]
MALIAAILLSAFAGREWPDGLEPVAYAVGGIVVAAGVALLAAGALGLGAALTPYPAPRSGGELRTAGVYGVVRHPMYGGGILIALGWSVLFATLVGFALTVVLAVFGDLKSRREELWLEQHHPDYGEYRRHVRHRLIPFVW